VKLQLREAAANSLIEKINDRHAQCLATTENIKLAVLRMVNTARECGFWLRKLKEQTPHGKWEGLFSNRGAKSETRFTFTYETARNYIRFAAENPAEITHLAKGVRSLKDAMIASGALPAPSFPQQQLRMIESSFIPAATKKLMDFLILWEKQMSLRPVQQWTQDLAIQFVNEMQPVLRKLNEAYAMAEQRAQDGGSAVEI
jgi:hypothetical protein